MRQPHTAPHRRWPVRLWAKLLAVLLVLCTWGIDNYVETQFKPSLMQIAEYEARSIMTDAIHAAVQCVLLDEQVQGASLYTVTHDCVQLDTYAANQIRNALIAEVQEKVESLPLREYKIPFGSLTGNAILSGHGPGWRVQLQPQGYVQALWHETSESLSINVTRYTAEIEIVVTVNMVLDGRTETLDVCDTIPVSSILLRGQTPSVYAEVSD